MSRFDFTLSYKAGSTNHADPLSRRPDLSGGVESDNKSQILLLSRLFNSSSQTLVDTIPSVHVKATEIISLDLISLIRHSCAEHELLVNVALNKLLKEGPQAMQGALGEWTHQDGIT